MITVHDNLFTNQSAVSALYRRHLVRLDFYISIVTLYCNNTNMQYNLNQSQVCIVVLTKDLYKCTGNCIFVEKHVKNINKAVHVSSLCWTDLWKLLCKSG